MIREMLDTHDWSVPYCQKIIRGPYIVIKGDRKTLWKDAEVYFKNIWACAEIDIDFWVNTSYKRTEKDVIFCCEVKISQELQNLLLKRS